MTAQERLEKQQRLQRGKAIIEGNIQNFRSDGYTNMLNKYGTSQDNSTAYNYQPESFADDMELTRLYEGNGLFAKIIDRPAEECIKHGFDLGIDDESVNEYLESRYDALDLEAKFSTAVKWARLYGGSIIVMVTDDGKGLEEPLDWKRVKGIKELRVFDRSVVQPDYTSIYRLGTGMDKDKPIGTPDYYDVFSIYGTFRVHWSRCLVFKNSEVPEKTSNALYRWWGIPEYVKIKQALRECMTSHTYSVQLLERCVQAIYKMRNLSNMLGTEQGEDNVIRRLQAIDMARNILNSIAIDVDGEDYDYKQSSISGVKDVLDSTCNMLSAVTEIPQTVLFGRSPSGMNATGESDFENYYNMIERIQKMNMKANLRTLIDLILIQGKKEKRFNEIPVYKVSFNPLWSMSEMEQANMNKIKADTEHVKANTANIYVMLGALDPTEVRAALKDGDDWKIADVIQDDDDSFDIFEGEMDIEGLANQVKKEEMQNKQSNGEYKQKAEAMLTSLQDTVNKAFKSENKKADSRYDGEDIRYGCGVIVMNEKGEILVADRTDGDGTCGPGGHIQDDESVMDGAIRETIEEFSITPLELIPIGDYKSSSRLFCDSKQYLCIQYTGEPRCKDGEMENPRWVALDELAHMDNLYEPFRQSLIMLIDYLIDGGGTDASDNDTRPT